MALLLCYNIFIGDVMRKLEELSNLKEYAKNVIQLYLEIMKRKKIY